jgi:ABC-type Na+ efflux pump permease subunit
MIPVAVLVAAIMAVFVRLVSAPVLHPVLLLVRPVLFPIPVWLMGLILLVQIFVCHSFIFCWLKKNETSEKKAKKTMPQISILCSNKNFAGNWRGTILL